MRVLSELSYPSKNNSSVKLTGLSVGAAVLLKHTRPAETQEVLPAGALSSYKQAEVFIFPALRYVSDSPQGSRLRGSGLKAEPSHPGELSGRIRAPCRGWGWVGRLKARVSRWSTMQTLDVMRERVESSPPACG